MAKRERDPYEDVIRRAKSGEDVGEALTDLFFDAIATEDVEGVRALLKYVDINRPTTHYKWLDSREVIVTPLLFCIIHGSSNFEIFEMILAHPDIDVNGRDSKYRGNTYTPLMYYIYYGSTIFTSRLLKHPKLNVNATGGPEFETALQFAIGHYDSPMYELITHKSHILAGIKLLLSHPKINVNLYNEDYNHHVLHVAVLHIDDDDEFQLELVKLLLGNRYINVNLKDSLGKTPLMVSTFNLKVVVELLKHPNIDVNAKTRDGEPLICFFAKLLPRYIDYRVFIAVLRHPKIDVNARQDSNGVTLLHILSKIEIEDQEWNYTAVADLLTIHPNINPNVPLKIQQGGTPLVFAINRKNFKIAELITSLRNIDYNTIEENSGWTTFMAIVSQRSDYFVQKALRHHSTNVNAQNINGETALMFAIYINYRRGVIEILKHPDTDVFLVSNNGKMALDYCGDDLMCKAIIFRRMIWNRKYARLGRDASKMIALHRMRDHLCREMSTEANRADLLVLAELLGVPRGLWQDATKAELCRNVADIISIGGTYDEVAFAAELQKRPEKQRRMHVRTQSMMESFRQGLEAFNIVDTGGKTLNQLMLELNRIF